MKIIDIFTDGSYVKKGGKEYCGYGIYFKNNEYKPISRPFKHQPITNNRAELYAILKALIICNIINENSKKNNKPLIKEVNIYSDSRYCVKTFNDWLPKWKKTKKEYLNADIINQIDECLQNCNFKINFIHIFAHTNNKDENSIGNSIADTLAKKGAFK